MVLDCECYPQSLQALLAVMQPESDHNVCPEVAKALDRDVGEQVQPALFNLYALNDQQLNTTS